MTNGFGLSNLPYGSVITDSGAPPALCVRLGDEAVVLASLDLDVDREMVDRPNADQLIQASPAVWREVREAIESRLREEAPPSARFALNTVRACAPFSVVNYVDFYSSLEHATNLGRMFRPGGDPLLPNWRHLPIGYHGRSSTVVVSGTPIRRPRGQVDGPDGLSFSPTERLDIELELGAVIGGAANQLGEAITIEAAAERIFGYVLVNDWSARDIQRWEYVPLGPFLGKSFATSISPWIIPADAVGGSRRAGPTQDPEPLPYLRQAEPRGLDIELEVVLNGQLISSTNSVGLYWSVEQQLAHAASNGAVISPGDLHASGTISGASRGSEGSFIELTMNGQEPLSVNGQQRTFLEDGDTVVLRGRAGDVSLGEVSGTVLAAFDPSL